MCVKTIMQGLNEIAENDPSIIEKTVKDLQSVSANINSYDTMIDMFIKSNSDLADNLAKLQEVLPQIKDVLTGTTDVADIANKSLDNVTDDIANQIDAQLKAMNELTDSALDSLDKAVQLSITDIGQAGVELSKANKQLKELIDQNKALEDAIDSLSKVDGIDPAVITALKSALASVNAMENIAYNLVQQCVELIETDKIYIRNLSIVIFLCSGILSRFAIFCLSTLHLCFVKLLEDINNIICTVKLKSICLIIPSEWSKFGETGIQFFRILYFGNDQDDALGTHRDGLDH